MPRLRPIILIAIVLRLGFLVAEPRLSPDVYRYRWDAKVFAAARNPYALPPSSPELLLFRDPMDARIIYPELRTIYPPGSELLFLLWGVLGAALPSLRLLLIAIDAAICAVLFRTAPRAALFWAVVPLSIFESAWSMHLDAIGGLLLLLAANALRDARPLHAGVAIAVGALVKITSVAALVATPRRQIIRVATIAIAVIVAVTLPFGSAVMGDFAAYATRWEFNSPLYSILERTVSATGLADHAKDAFTRFKDPLGLNRISASVYPLLYAGFLARALSALILAASWIVIAVRNSSPESKALDAAGMFILVSPTIHPWYWLSILPLAIARGATTWIALALLAPLSYLIDEGGGELVMWLCYTPLLVVAIDAARSHVDGR